MTACSHIDALCAAGQVAPAAPNKRVFFVRHGESRWNEAQRKKDVLEMVSHVDHPLNQTGYMQATCLRAAVAAAMAPLEGEA